MCYDHLNEFADISFGDAWLPEVVKQRKGETIVITRTEKGENLIQKAKEEGVIEVKEVSRTILMQAQKFNQKKKNWLEAHLYVAKLFGGAVPSYYVKYPKSTKPQIFQSACDYLNSQIPYSRLTYFFLKNLPLPLLKVYIKANNVMNRVISFIMSA